MDNVTMKCISILLFFLISQCTSIPRANSDLQCPTPYLKNGRIRAKGRGGRIIRYSCSSNYELVGNRYSTCIRGSWDTPTPICVNNGCANLPMPMHAVVGEKYQGAVLMYFCEPGYRLVGNSEIYCDGRQWNSTAPYCRDTKAVAPTSCDFEKEGLCWWEQDPKHDFDWIKHRFGTPSSHIGTGPSHDHTLGAGYDGYYLYVEASGRLVNDTARILSPLYSANLTDSGCFSFWYHMYGATIGSLNIYFKPENEISRQIMWSRSGNQGNIWQRGVFSLPAINTSFQLIIEGVRGSSYVSDIAIDDLALLQGDQCAFKNLTVNTTPANDGDEVELFNAMQSCRNRCVNTLSETTPSSDLYTNPDVCQCSIDCAETSSCCPDFAEYCIYESTDPAETVTPLTKETIGKVYTTLQTNKNTILSSTRKNEEQTKIESTIPMTESTTPTTMLKITTAIVTRTETTAIETRATSKEPMRPTTIASTTTISVETPFFASVSETPKPTDGAKFLTNTEAIVSKARRDGQTAASSSLPAIISIFIGILTTFTIITSTVLIILRKRKSYKRNSKGSCFSEDSDVRFLTSDEVLDFSLAKPADEHL